MQVNSATQSTPVDVSLSIDADRLADSGGAGISDMARSLASTLQAAPARESRQAAALRRHLIVTTRALADQSDQRIRADEFDLASARLLVATIRRITADLAHASAAVPPGIAVVLQAFAERLLPDALLILRPIGHFEYKFREHLTQFESLVRETQVTTLNRGKDVPTEALVLRYPEGEQDNVLLSCNLLRAFRPRTKQMEGRRVSDAFAVWLLGPAYFFAFAAQLEMSGARDGSSANEYARLHRIGALLEASGWLDQPDVGPLLRQSRDRILLPQTDSTPLLTPTEELQQESETGARQFLPEDFDRDVPRLWGRLRQLIPPNDLELDAVESAEPADAAAILNAGWSFALLHIEDMHKILGCHSAEDRYEARQVLNRLLSKGIELSHIASLWRKARAS